MSARAAPGKGIGAQALGLLAETRACLTLDALASEIDRPRKQITHAICRLITDKYVVRREAGCYEITAAGMAAHAAGYKSGPQRPHTGKKPPRPSLRAGTWKTLRLRRKATIHDIITNAATGAERNPESNILHYLTALERGGYVSRLARRVPGTAPTSNGHVVWLLVKDTGPLAPMLNVAARTLRDPNTDEIIHLVAPEAAA
jgi:hypothetical protein